MAGNEEAAGLNPQRRVQYNPDTRTYEVVHGADTVQQIGQELAKVREDTRKMKKAIRKILTAQVSMVNGLLDVGEVVSASLDRTTARLGRERQAVEANARREREQARQEEARWNEFYLRHLNRPLPGARRNSRSPVRQGNSRSRSHDRAPQQPGVRNEMDSDDDVQVMVEREEEDIQLVGVVIALQPGGPVATRGRAPTRPRRRGRTGSPCSSPHHAD